MVEPTKSIITLFREIQEGRQASFNELFLSYYERLVVFAMQYVKQREPAEEIASELFVKLWIKRNDLQVILKPEVYLYVSVRNAALNYCRNIARFTAVSMNDHEQYQQENNVIDNYNSSSLEQSELISLLNRAIDGLPDRQKLIFRLVKEDGLKCREVAEILNISTRTVENQVYKAVKTLADSLSNYLGYHPQKNVQTKQSLTNLLLNLFF